MDSSSSGSAIPSPAVSSSSSLSSLSSELIVGTKDGSIFSELLGFVKQLKRPTAEESKKTVVFGAYQYFDVNVTFDDPNLTKLIEETAHKTAHSTLPWFLQHARVTREKLEELSQNKYSVWTERLLMRLQKVYCLPEMFCFYQGLSIEDKKTKELFLQLLGSDKVERKSHLKVIQQFASQEEGSAYLNPLLKNRFDMFCQLSTLKALEYSWSGSLPPISVEDVRRALIGDCAIHYTALSVNGYSLLPFKLLNDETSDQYGERFLIQLIQLLCTTKIKEQAKSYLHAAQMNGLAQHNFGEYLPSFSVLRLLTPGAWYPVRGLLEEFSPDLFSARFFTKQIQGSHEGDITGDLSEPKVSQTKKFAIYENLGKKKDAFRVDESRPLCYFTVKWTLRPNGTTHKGVLQIINHALVHEHLEPEVKEEIFKLLYDLAKKIARANK